MNLIEILAEIQRIGPTSYKALDEYLQDIGVDLHLRKAIAMYWNTKTLHLQDSKGYKHFIGT